MPAGLPLTHADVYVVNYLLCVITKSIYRDRMQQSGNVLRVTMVWWWCWFFFFFFFFFFFLYLFFKETKKPKQPTRDFSICTFYSTDCSSSAITLNMTSTNSHMSSPSMSHRFTDALSVITCSYWLHVPPPSQSVPWSTPGIPSHDPPPQI